MKIGSVPPKIVASKTETITVDGKERKYIWELTTGKVGFGTDIHYLHLNDKSVSSPICGSGRTYAGNKRNYSTRFVDSPVTCQKCQKIFEMRWKKYSVER